MAVLDDMVVSVPDATPAEVAIDAIKLSIARQFWDWYEAHKNDVIIKKKFLFISATVYVRDLFPLFHILFGDPNEL